MAHTTANRGRREDRLDAPERYEGYAVRDPRGRKIGSVAELFLNAYHEPEYVKVRMGLFGLKTVLIPVTAAVIDGERRSLTLQ